jgi:hypothetical protein
MSMGHKTAARKAGFARLFRSGKGHPFAFTPTARYQNAVSF